MVTAVNKVKKAPSGESKTARASRPGAKAEKFVKLCSQCNTPMIATKLVTETGHSRGMFWVCEQGHQVPTK